MLKKIVLFILIVGAIGVCTGIYLWHKPAPKAEDVKGIAISAMELSKQFNTDEKKANAEYLDKAISVSGTVTDVSKNQDGGVVITLESGDPMTPVLCTMREKTATATKGQQATIKGFCRGNNLGVVLNDCIN